MTSSKKPYWRMESPPRFSGSGPFNIVLGLITVVLVYLIGNAFFGNSGDYAAPFWEMVLFAPPLLLIAFGMVGGRLIRIAMVKRELRKYEDFGDDPV